MAAGFAPEKMTEGQLLRAVQQQVDYIVDDYLQGRLSRKKVKRYQANVGDLVRELLVRGTQLQLDFGATAM